MGVPDALIRDVWADATAVTSRSGLESRVSGTVYDEEAPIPLPNFRSSRAMVSSVNKNRYLVADRILSYRSEDERPTMTDAISGPRKERFGQALTATGMWGELVGTDRFRLISPSMLWMG